MPDDVIAACDEPGTRPSPRRGRGCSNGEPYARRGAGRPHRLRSALSAARAGRPRAGAPSRAGPTARRWHAGCAARGGPLPRSRPSGTGRSRRRCAGTRRRQLVQPPRSRPLDRGGHQRGAHAAAAPVRGDHHPDLAVPEPALDHEQEPHDPPSSSATSVPRGPSSPRALDVDRRLGRDAVPFLGHGGEQQRERSAVAVARGPNLDLPGCRAGVCSCSRVDEDRAQHLPPGCGRSARTPSRVGERRSGA